MGFTPPLEKWLMNEINQKWILNLLKNKKLIVSSLFSENALNKLFNDSTSVINNKLRIYRLIILNRWHERIYK